MFPIESEEFAPQIIKAAQEGNRLAQRYQRKLANLTEEFEQDFDPEAPLSEQFALALDHVHSMSSAERDYDHKSARIAARAIVPMLESMGAPEEVIKGARQAAGLELPGLGLDTATLDEEGNVVDLADDAVSGDSTIPGIDPNFVAEPERPNGIVDFDGKTGADDDEEGS